MNGLQLGDVVRLKGQKVKMTLVGMTRYVVICGWFTTEGLYKETEFDRSGASSPDDPVECKVLERWSDG